MKFSKNTKYYDDIVYEWNLPSGHTCPSAIECLVKVDRKFGKFTNKSKSFKCYAAAERFPNTRELRWSNFESATKGILPEITLKMNAIRIHASGDFFNQEYFDLWLETCKKHPNVEFWAYTKSLNFWINRIDEIPSNLTLTASRGGKFDDYIEEYNLKNVRVVDPNLVKMTSTNKCIWNNKEYLIDFTDDIARLPKIKDFLLLDNNKKLKK